MQLIVNLTDVNDNSPQFPGSLPSLSIEENRVTGSTITIVSATDADQGSNAALTYNIVGGDTFGKSLIATKSVIEPYRPIELQVFYGTYSSMEL